jgi:hypothetical protein
VKIGAGQSRASDGWWEFVQESIINFLPNFGQSLNDEMFCLGEMFCGGNEYIFTQTFVQIGGFGAGEIWVSLDVSKDISWFVFAELDEGRHRFWM